MNDLNGKIFITIILSIGIQYSKIEVSNSKVSESQDPLLNGGQFPWLIFRTSFNPPNGMSH